ncbi:hypothetical protein GV794_11330 [Nocardia cyriacigeorgica]|uniref:Ava_C0101 and related proteins n=2 Tax=Nocardia cyriacigeorgica TaxID=135487 RepID=A0A6P1CY55_9NOCA|nr:hypothetical protein [Nocardia cyriacigeorgica]NEW56238.1 hypothetical protein [Nocardia cyriacigeorgica]
MLMPDSRIEWPHLPVAEWADTRDTLHMWMQVVGKVRLAHAPLLNHWWQVTLYVSARGLTTSAIHYDEEVFDIEFDFVDHRLVIRAGGGSTRMVDLAPKSVARFYEEIMRALDDLGLGTWIQARPNEVDPSIPFAEDVDHRSYDPAAVHAFWRQLVHANRLLNEFRSGFVGKTSPVHFYWGAMDLACTRFSGRTAPEHAGGAPHCADWVMVEGYSHELSSCGFWPGGGEEGAFYAYAYPEPKGYAERPIRTPDAYYDQGLGEFVLPYEKVRTSYDPSGTVSGFLRDTYEAAAVLGDWDRTALECDPSRWAHERAAARWSQR